MSKKKNNSAEPVEVAPVAVAETATTAPVEEPKKKKCVFRALLTLIVSVAAFFLPLVTFTTAWAKDSSNLLNMVKEFNFAKFEGNGLSVMLANFLPYVFAAFLVLAALFAFIALFAGKKPLITACIFMLIGAILYVAGVALISSDKLSALTFDIIAIAIAAAALFLLIIACVSKKAKKVKEEIPVVDPVAEMMKTFRTEEVIEAYAYEGGPVAGIEIAEEVFPTVAAIEAQRDPDGVARNTVASLLGNGFDPFLITLNEKEKNAFIDLYVLKCSGVMPEIPGYVVGGDNKDFFNKVFIYLGQYREKIPGDLLAKMYNFSMKI